MPARRSSPRAANRSSNARSWSSSNLRLGSVAGRSRFGEGVGEFQCGAPHRECSVHRRITLRAATDHAAIFERDPVGIFEIDRPSPPVVDDFCRLNALGTQFVALFGQRSRRAGLESKMIEAGGNAEPAVDPRIVFCGYIRNSVW